MTEPRDTTAHHAGLLASRALWHTRAARSVKPGQELGSLNDPAAKAATCAVGGFFHARIPFMAAPAGEPQGSPVHSLRWVAGLPTLPWAATIV